MKRREFIAGFCATTVGLRVAYAQDGRVRRIGMLNGGEESDHFIQARHTALREHLGKLGWIAGNNARFDVRFAEADPARMRAHADELVRLAPDVIFVSSGPTARTLLQRTQTIPVVFANVGDPVALGLLKNIARPEGNATGIAGQYQSIGGKWVELLKDAVPHVDRVALIFAADNINEQYFAVIGAAAELMAVKTIRAPYRSPVELEHAVDTFAAEPNGGLLMLPPPPSPYNRALINRLAIKHRLPTMYQNKYYPAEGGMMGYGADSLEVYRIAGSYIDRILRGAKINELPVQFPTKFDLAINLKTARAIGVTIPQSVLLRADEVIE